MEPLIDFFSKRKNSNGELEICWTKLQISIFDHYFLYLSPTCDFEEMPIKELLSEALWTERGSSEMSAQIPVRLAQELQGLFMVPRLKKKFAESENPIKKYQLVHAFVSFLLQLLYHKTYLILYLSVDRIDSLEKELRFLLTVLGDTSLMVCADEHEEFQKLLGEFEAVANEAGSLLHSIYFPTGRAFGKMDMTVAVALNHIDLLKSIIRKFLDRMPFNSRSVYMTPKTFVVDSLLIVDSIIYDLEDVMNRDDNPVADVKDQIEILHRGLISLQSCIKHSEIQELNERLMRIGDVAHEAQYLIMSFLVGDAPRWYLNNRLTYVNHKIKFIGSELQEITKKHEFGDLKVAKYFTAQPSLQAKRNTEVDDGIVGFEDKETYILDKLVGGGTECLQFISIFGMPGIGKTTLAKKLYNHPSVKYRFDKLSWCVVSQTYQVRSILANILSQISSELEKDRILTMEEESLTEHIYKTLIGRRYLVVMDDIWDSKLWDELLLYFPDDANGSRILLTTRINDVAPCNSIIYPLPFLSEDECWKLLEKKVFIDKPCPPELLEFGKKIAKNCHGVPLVIVVIAGILSTMENEKSTWEEVGENLASYIFDGGDDSLVQILELSYKHLPQHLKPCFLYFGAFQEDKEFPVGKLMRLWIAEGFIRKEKEKTVDNVAEEYLNELIDKSLVMVAKRRSDGGVKTCVIHDLLRVLCLKTCEEENFLKFVESDSYSIYNKDDHLQALQYSVTWSYCQYMRSFCGCQMMLPLHVRDIRLLRVLHFDSRSIYINGIEFQVCLRYLVISDLPPSVGSLVNLEYLHVEASETICLSSAIMKMKKLRYIHVSPEAVYDNDCNCSQTNNLEFLSYLAIGEPKDEDTLKSSPHLRKLKLSTFRHVDLSFLGQLESLNIRYDVVGLEGISFPSNIKKLTLSGSKLTWEEMSIIGRLENLEVLKLEFYACEGRRWDTRDVEFQKVKFLKMKILDLIEWNVASSENFPELQRLVLIDCCHLLEIPSEIGEIATLHLIEVHGIYKKSLLESAKRIQQEQLIMGNEELGVITDIQQLPLEDKRNLGGDHAIIGFEERTTDVLDLLVEGTERLQVISIFGMPGLGKTTLARKLYNHPLVNCRFDKLSWCAVSQAYMRRNILTNILIQIESEFEKDWILKMEEQSLVEHIYRTLKGRRFIVVIDDIWDLSTWYDLQRCLPDDGNGSRILFTSRIKDVVPHNGLLYALSFLSNDQCWKLLKKKVFGNKPCPSELLGTGKRIAAYCCGLPLAVIVIAGVLSSMDMKKSTWEEVRENLAHTFYGGENLMQILGLGYKHLPEHLKPCFLYFGAFHREEIPIGKLLRFWIAEGFIREEGEKSQENVAEKYLMELINRSLVIVAKIRSDGGVKTIVIHDLLHDLCLKACEAENFLNFKESKKYPIYRKDHNRPQAPRYSATSFHGQRRTSPFYVHDARLPRVLHCDCIVGRYIGIEFLVCLKYLVISDLPPSIGSIVNLEYLCVETNETVYLPSAIMKMKKLRYIHVGFEAIYDEDCNSSQTNNLEFLSCLCIREPKDEEMLRCSPHLRKLKLSTFRQVDLNFFPWLESLSVRFYELGMEGSSFPSNLKKLTLSGSMLTWEEMSIIGRLENLEVLKLEFYAYEGRKWDTRDGEFQKVKFLKMKIVDLIEWNVESSEHFPELQRLVLIDCCYLQEIPFEIGEIAALQLIEVQGLCQKSLVESAKRIQQELWEWGNEELKVITHNSYIRGFEVL